MRQSRIIDRWTVPAIATALITVPLGVGAAVPETKPHIPITTPGYETPYQPDGTEERGLWMEVDEAERRIKHAPQLIKDAKLNDYVRSVLCRSVGEKQCSGVRLYLVRSPHFNASMSPNGMMIIYSGLLLRLRNEAQLAAVLSHEFVHYEHKHSLLMFREVKKKGNQAVWLAMTGVGLIAAIGLEQGLYSYSRDMEREADLGGLEKLGKAGYAKAEAAAIWSLMREEMDATAAARKQKSKKDKDLGAYNTHPPTSERLAYLKEEAAKQSSGATDGVASYQAAMAEWWPQFAEDQVKRNDFGASEFLLTRLAESGWTPWLLFARGELYRMRALESDLDQAVRIYSEAIDSGADLPVLWRGRGLALLKLGRTQEGKADLNTYLAKAGAASDKAMIAMLAGGTT